MDFFRAWPVGLRNLVTWHLGYVWVKHSLKQSQAKMALNTCVSPSLVFTDQSFEWNQARLGIREHKNKRYFTLASVWGGSNKSTGFTLP